MPRLPVRRLLIDLESPIPRHWMGGDAFRTALFNALSMGFPIGEQFFIDSVRKGLQELAIPERLQFERECLGFIGQEATHRQIHTRFNQHLTRQGLTNHWEPRVQQRLRQAGSLETRHWLAITAATEHFTTTVAICLLSNPQWLDHTEERLRQLWLWHSSEEAEHKCTAFDLYRALGGSEVWRKRWFLHVGLFFSLDLACQTLHNLHRDGTFWRSSTRRSGLHFLFGRIGLIRCLFRPLRAYLRTGFHPSESDSSSAADGLQGNRHACSVLVRESNRR